MRICTSSRPTTNGTKTNKNDPLAKDAEGRLSSAMNVAEDLKEGAKAVTRKVSHAAAQLADDKG